MWKRKEIEKVLGKRPEPKWSKYEQVEASWKWSEGPNPLALQC